MFLFSEQIFYQLNKPTPFWLVQNFEIQTFCLNFCHQLHDFLSKILGSRARKNLQK